MAGGARGPGGPGGREGQGPWPAVLYAHGLIVDLKGLKSAARAGYDIKGICEALAGEGFLAFAPVRTSGRGNISGHVQEVTRALDYMKTLPEVDASRVAIIGSSRGGLLAFMAGVNRSDLSAMILLAPAPGHGHFEWTIKQVPGLKAPVLLMVEESDSAQIRNDVDMLESALKVNDKVHKAIRYDRGGGHRLFWKKGYFWDDLIEFLKEKTSAPGAG